MRFIASIIGESLTITVKVLAVLPRGAAHRAWRPDDEGMKYEHWPRAAGPLVNAFCVEKTESRRVR